MAVEISVEASNERLNRLVAITVVVQSAPMGRYGLLERPSRPAALSGLRG